MSVTFMHTIPKRYVFFIIFHTCSNMKYSFLLLQCKRLFLALHRAKSSGFVWHEADMKMKDVKAEKSLTSGKYCLCLELMSSKTRWVGPKSESHFFPLKICICVSWMHDNAPNSHIFDIAFLNKSGILFPILQFPLFLGD